MFDILVVGAGPNGLATACALGGAALQRPLRVGLIDARDPRQPPGVTPDTRGSAIIRATRNMLTALGIWPALAPHAQPMTSVIVTDGGSTDSPPPVLLSFLADSEEKAAAVMIENRHLVTGLLAAAEASPSITFLTGTAVAAVAFGPGLAAVTLADGRIVKAPLLVGADGRNSMLRKTAGIETTTRSYGQSAITATLAHEHPHEGRAEEHFSPAGVLAMLPLPGNSFSLVWGEQHAEAERLIALDDAAFQDSLARRLGPRLGKLTLLTPRRLYPLELMIAQSLIAPRLALVGDAAHVIHPLAGLGLNLGFKDAASLADVLADAARRGEDLGSVAVLERYQRQRRFDTFATTSAMDGLNALFVNNNPVLKLLRDAGLMMVNRMPPLKNIFMQEAAGTTGAVPRLMRGLVP